jgi:acetyl esterase/lipase
VRPANRFLLSGVAWAAATGNALKPFDRVGPGSMASFVSALGPSEFPMHELAFQAGVGLIAARGGGVRGVRGALGLGLTAASFAGLWRLRRDAQAAQDVLEAALVDGLGPHYRKRIAEPFAPRPDVPLTRRSVLLTNSRSRRTYRAAADLAYGDHGRRNQLDVWRRADLPPDGRAPVLVQVHGGAWIIGRKEGQGEPLLAHLAERGWVCVTINYRLSPRATWPDHIVDVKRAIAWTRASIAAYGGDPDFIAVTGGSAGAHLASLAALTPDRPELQPGFEEVDTSVAAAIPLYGLYDIARILHPDDGFGRRIDRLVAEKVIKTPLADARPIWEQASPITHVRPDAPPFFVLHGVNDSVIPIEQARSFVGRLRSASLQPVAYAELPRAQHAFDMAPSVRVHHTAHAIERFLAVVRSQHGGATPAEAVTSDRV